ncbi:MAG: ribosome biogenesis GTPase Der [Spirochaeta sp. LUC14_002_19_P3]|nr:MAG: ribosome biogenesis GTPase Der [Spirochaeta sp. LUC14_002_19_P3]
MSGVWVNHSKLRVVITGRPNVGKSTLFNRLCGRRRAITNPVPGVTRDALEEECRIGGIPVTLIDTGGVKADFEDSFDRLVAERALTALENADIIILLLEIGTLTVEDESLIAKLRRYSNRIIPVVNKADTVEKDYQASEYYALGLGTPLPVSAAHGRGLEKLIEAVKARAEHLPPNPDGPESAGRPLTIALAGRPNAGKSTLANQISGREASLVSEIAGTTRDTVISAAYRNNRMIRIIDTAGMRRRAKVSEDIEYYSVNRAIQAMFEADVTILIIDANEGLTDQDKKISAQAVKKGHTIVMALNKWDEAVPDKIRLKKAEDKIRFQFPVLEWAPLLPVSALKGYGIENLIKTVIKADSQQNQRIDTAKLNRALMEWISLTPPPTRKGKPFKVKYITQVSIRPVRFIAFVNRKEGFPESYRRFLVNQIRREFNFTLIPVDLSIKEGQNEKLR